MRSRYSAYALGGYGEYLLKTWFPPMAQGLCVEQLSKKSLSWQKLDVLNRTQQGDEGTVEFKAWFQSDSTEDGEPEVLHELSEFKRIGGRWLYVGGRVE